MLRLKLLRLNAGLSQWELSRSAGMSQGRYSMIERALISPTPEERTALANALSAPPRSLLRPVIAPRPRDREGGTRWETADTQVHTTDESFG
jgi:transcriptional regulator with XRE-family HTH domain